MTETELEKLCQIAEAAGREIIAVYKNGGETWQKGDKSPLTSADLRADQVIRQELEGHFPGIFILSEESASSGGLDAERFFLVDPLDGTKEFLQRNDEFTVNIALIEKGLSVAGVVLAPALGELFYAARNMGAWKRNSTGVRRIATANLPPNEPLRVIGSRSHCGDRLKSWLATLEHAYTFFAVGSSLKFCRIAEGHADIYPRFGSTSQWDTAAAQAILEEAGGCVIDLRGNALRYGLNRPVMNSEFIALGNESLKKLVNLVDEP